MEFTWTILDITTVRRVLSRFVHGQWTRLNPTNNEQFLAQRLVNGKERWFHATVPREIIQNVLEHSMKWRVLQIGTCIGEWDSNRDVFTLTVGGLFTFALFFHPIAIARHENSFLDGRPTTADNPRELEGLSDEKAVAVSSKHDVLLGLARVTSVTDSKDVFLTPIWTVKTTFQQEWREKHVKKVKKKKKSRGE